MIKLLAAKQFIVNSTPVKYTFRKISILLLACRVCMMANQDQIPNSIDGRSMSCNSSMGFEVLNLCLTINAISKILTISPQLTKLKK